MASLRAVQLSDSHRFSGNCLRVWLALSGGRDSVGLLAAAAAARDLGLLQGLAATVSLEAIHVHHGLSPNADDWVAFCRETCARLGVPLRVENVSVVPRGGEGLEAAARRARYQVFGDLPGDLLLLAHHGDDQVETVLFNLFRGTGLRGLAGMAAQRALTRPGRPPLMLLRPWLALTREEVNAWLADTGLGWVEDESNTDEAYTRNYLRHGLLPGILQRFPGGRAAILRAAAHARETDGALAGFLEESLAALRGPQGGLDLARLRDLAGVHPERVALILRFALAQAGAQPPSAQRLGAWQGELLTGSLAVGGFQDFGPVRAARWRGELFFLPIPIVLPAPRVWQGEDCIPWAGGQVTWQTRMGEGIAAVRLGEGPVTLRCRRPGDHLQIHPGRPSRELSRHWQEAGVPPWEREWLPCLEVAGRLVWAARIGVDAAWACPPGEAGWLPCWSGDVIKAP